MTDDDSIEIGDFVLVPTRNDNHESVVEVVNIGYFNEENVPVPVEKTKKVICKCADDDSGFTTTCGNPHFYLEKADGQKYYIDFYNKEIKLTRNEVIPYINFIEFPFAYAGYDSAVKGIVWMNDKTLRYINEVDYDEEILPNKFLNEDGNEIVAEFVYYYEKNDDFQQKVYVNVIEQNGNYYTIEYDKNFVYEDKNVMLVKSDKTVSAMDVVIEDYVTTKMDIYFTDGSKIEYNPENTYLLR